jgi:preprotein translocase subunit SecG
VTLVTPDLAHLVGTALAPVLGASVILPIVKWLLMTLFVITSLLLILVILIQEGKGGGIAGAFGGAAADTFGVKAGSVNRFTAYLATAFIVLALLHAGVASAINPSVFEPVTPASPASSTTESVPTKPPAEPAAPASPMQPGPTPPAGMDDTPMGDGMSDAMGEPPPTPPAMDESPMGPPPPAPPAPAPVPPAEGTPPPAPTGMG